MSNLWHHSDSSGNPVAAPLRGERVFLPSLSAESEARPGACVRCVPEPGSTVERWALMAAPGTSIQVNGQPLVLGLRVLRDRDELVFAGARFFFSTERLAQVEPLPASAAGVFCARCRQKIEVESPAVRCPACGTWCHEGGELCCWTYAPTCPLCDQATALDAEYRWQPEF